MPCWQIRQLSLLPWAEHLASGSAGHRTRAVCPCARAAPHMPAGCPAMSASCDAVCLEPREMGPFTRRPRRCGLGLRVTWPLRDGPAAPLGSTDLPERPADLRGRLLPAQQPSARRLGVGWRAHGGRVEAAGERTSATPHPAEPGARPGFGPGTLRPQPAPKPRGTPHPRSSRLTRPPAADRSGQGGSRGRRRAPDGAAQGEVGEGPPPARTVHGRAQRPGSWDSLEASVRRPDR